MEPFPALDALTDEDLAVRIADLEREEDGISLRRRMLHGRIDLLRHELVARVKNELGEVSGAAVADALARPFFEGTGDLPDEHDLGPMPDASAMSSDELRSAIRTLEREEDDVSLRRRVLHGQIDILRAERYRRTRGAESIGPDDLGSILGGSAR